MPASKDRLVHHIKTEYVKKGYSEEEAERIAYATVTKQEEEAKEDGSD